MCDTVRGIQGITNLPLQIDTSDPAAMEQALRIYNGKPLINSVNGKKESMEKIFPLAKKITAESWFALRLMKAVFPKVPRAESK